MPDGGLFTPDQYQKGTDAPLPGQRPSRGVVECKRVKDDAWLTAETRQVTGYWEKYRQVLVTNYRDFLLVGQNAEGRPVQLESYRLAAGENEFWKAAENPAATVAAQGDRFLDFLRRVMLRPAPLADPKDVAWFLASYARDARARMDTTDLPALAEVRKALEDALGLTFEGPKGDHFFRSTLVQTLFYGVFSAWVLWHRTKSANGREFDWEKAANYLHVPILHKLFRELADRQQLDDWKLAEVLDWTAGVLNRVDRPAFFARFSDAEAVQYFYEPFLQAFDPELRKQLGVWYTPPEVVRYMVARVDAVLREELGRPDGLADPGVYILDPCCGTGAYLVEVLRSIAATLRDKGEDALLGGRLKAAATDRLFGFEILPAPFVVAHLQIGLFLQAEGVPLEEGKKERAGVYLTNALTGWEPPKGPKQHLIFKEMEEERDRADRVKQTTPILVIIGNPPYNGFAGVSPAEEQGLVDVYKANLNKPVSEGGWGIRKFNLDDLYVRFFRIAERRIAEVSGKGIVCFISNYSYLADPSFAVLRQRFTHGFDGLWFDCLNGDSRETGKQTPDGEPDPSVFSTEYQRAGIRIGTAIGLLVRKEKRDESPVVGYRDFWGAHKREDLLASLGTEDGERAYTLARPSPENRYSFRPTKSDGAYLSWPRVVELSEVAPISGLQEMRRGALMATDRASLEERMKTYFDNTVGWREFSLVGEGLAKDGGRFVAKECRDKMLDQSAFEQGNVRRYSLYPFDGRWCYYSAARPLWNEPRPDLVAQAWPGNRFFVTRMFAERPNENICMTMTKELPDYHLLRPNAVAIPLRLGPEREGLRQRDFFSDKAVTHPRANLSDRARSYLAALNFSNPDANEESASLVWMHALAIGHAPIYLEENGEDVRQDWPRVPLPAERDTLLASNAAGRQVASLLDPEAKVEGITAGKTRMELKFVGVVARAGGGSLNPATELNVTARWGVAGKGGVCMPGKGKAVERAYAPDESEALAAGAAALGMDEAAARACLGETTFDVYLNDVAFWRNVPAGVWAYTLGGYQVMKKWLSYREKVLLGRGLKLEEVTEVTHMARRIAALLLLGPALDANYRAVKADVYPWPRPAPAAP